MTSGGVAVMGGMGSLLPWSNPAAKCLAIRGVGEAETPRRYPITAKAATVADGDATWLFTAFYVREGEAIAAQVTGAALKSKVMLVVSGEFISIGDIANRGTE